MDGKNNLPALNTSNMGAFLASYFKRGLYMLKNPIHLIPTLILCASWFILSVITAVFGRTPLLFIPISLLTFAQGGMYGGIIGALGGLLGKAVVAAFLNTVIIPLFNKNRRSEARLSDGFRGLVKSMAFKGAVSAAPLIGGTGAALMLYTIFNIVQTRENCIVGIMAAIMMLKGIARRGGFAWGFIVSFVNSFSKKKLAPDTLAKLLSGLALGFTASTMLSLAGLKLCWYIGTILAAVGIVIALALPNNKGGVKAAAFLVLLIAFSAPCSTAVPVNAQAGTYIHYTMKDRLTDSISDFFYHISYWFGNTSKPHTNIPETLIVDIMSVLIALLMSYDPGSENGDGDGDGGDGDISTGFLDPNDSSTVRSSVKEHDDGSLDVFDAPTNTWRKFWPTDDPEEGRVYISENGVTYPPDFLKQHIETRNDNAETLGADYRQAQENLQKQREQNAENLEKEREYWRQTIAENEKKRQEQERRDELFRKLQAKNPGVETLDDLKARYEENAQKELALQAELKTKDRILTAALVTTETVKAVNDAAADALGKVPGAGPVFHGIYTTTTNITEQVTISTLKGENPLKGVAKGAVNAAINEGQYYAGGAAGKYAYAIKAGAYIGGEGTKTFASDLIDGKDVTTALKNGLKDGATKGTTKLAFDYVSNKVNKSSDFNTIEKNAWNKAKTDRIDIINKNWKQHDFMERQLDLSRAQIAKDAWNQKIQTLENDTVTGSVSNIIFNNIYSDD